MRPFDINDRTTYLGASDLGPMLGLSPWRTRDELFLEKTGQIPGQPPSVSMRLGTILEPFVLTLLEEDVPGLVRLTTNTRVAHRDAVFFGAQLDATYSLQDTPVLAEGKTTGFLSKEWGAPGTDQIPAYYFSQVQGQLECLDGPELALVPLLVLSKKKFQVYQVKRDREMGRNIVSSARHFWAEVSEYWERKAAA